MEAPKRLPALSFDSAHLSFVMMVGKEESLL